MSSDLFFENKKYISAKNAASLTSYSRDYIGQLCRDKKIDSKRIGHTWYVSEESVLNYKSAPTTFDFSQNLKPKKDEIVKFLTDKGISTKKDAKPSSRPERNKNPFLSTKLKKAHHLFFSKNVNVLKPLASLAVGLILVIGIYGVCDGLVNFVPTTSRIAYEVSRSSLVSTLSPIKISEGISSAPTDSYDALEDILTFYSSTTSGSLISVGNSLQDSSFAFLDQLGIFAKNPPVYILSSFHSFALAEDKIIDTGVSTSAGAVASAHAHTFAFISDSIGGLPYATSYGKYVAHSLGSSVRNQALALTPVDSSGVVVYQAVNNLFDSAIYNPIRGVLGLNQTVIGSHILPYAPKVPSKPIVLINNSAQPLSQTSLRPTTATAPTVIEHIVDNTINTGISSDELDLRLQELDNKIMSKMYGLSTGGGGNITNVYQEIAGSQKIDQLTNTSITNPTIVGGSISGTSITGTSISVGSLSAGDATLGTTTVTNLIVSNTSTSTFAGGVNVTGSGCFSINGICLGGAGGGIGSVNSVNASGGTTGLAFSGGPIATSGVLTLGGVLGLANGGTATTTFYNGGVVFSDGAKLTQSSQAGNFFWDEANKRLGIGTTSPAESLSTAGLMYVGGNGTSTIEHNLHVIGNIHVGQNSLDITETAMTSAGTGFTIATQGEDNHLSLQSLGRVGVSTSSPWAVFSVEHNGANANMPIFAASQEGTSTPFMVIDYMGRVGVATNPSSTGAAFQVGNWPGGASAYFAGNVGIASTTAGSLFAIGGDGVGINFGLGTSTFSTTGGVNLAKGGCYAINGICLGGSNGIGSVTSVNASGGTTGLSFSGGPITTSGTLTLAGTLGLSNGGTATTTFYNGGLVFSDGTKLTQSSSAGGLFWDNTNQDLGLGTTSPVSLLALAGDAYIGGSGANSTTTIERNLNVLQNLKVGTSSTWISGSATSTFGGGISLTNGGCFAIGTTCIGGFSNTLANGGTATTTFYNGGLVFSDGAKLTQSSLAAALFWDNTNQRLGLGTTTPTALLALQGPVGSAQVLDIASSTGASMFHIAANGNVGLGTTTPMSTLTINSGDTTVPAFSVYQSTSGVVVHRYTSNTTWTKPANLDHVVVEVIGGGGGGGSSNDISGSAGGGGGSSAFGTSVIANGGGGGGAGSGCAAGSGAATTAGGNGGNGNCANWPGAGGGGAGYSKSTITAGSISSTVNIVVGTGGRAGISAGGGGAGGVGYHNGGNGVIGGGGGAGTSGDGSSSSGGTGGAGGTGSAVGDNTVAGSNGFVGFGGSGNGGVPGGGSGTAGTGSTLGGTDGTIGGGGGAGTQTSAGSNGGNGGDGVVIVTEYYSVLPGQFVAGVGANGDFAVGTSTPNSELSVQQALSGNDLFDLSSLNGTSFLHVNSSGYLGLGTTAPQYPLNIFSSSGSQLALSAGSGINQWTFANEGGNFYLSTTTVAGNATTSSAALSVSGSGFGTTTVSGLSISAQATSTSNVGFNITTGCFAIAGNCVGAGGPTGSAHGALTGTYPNPTLNYITSAKAGSLAFASSTTGYLMLSAGSDGQPSNIYFSDTENSNRGELHLRGGLRLDEQNVSNGITFGATNNGIFHSGTTLSIVAGSNNTTGIQCSDEAYSIIGSEANCTIGGPAPSTAVLAVTGNNGFEYSTGSDAPDVLVVTGGSGSPSTQGNPGRNGSNIRLTAGAGGGSNLSNGNGGSLFLNPGAAGASSGTAGVGGSIVLGNLRGYVGVGTTTPQWELTSFSTTSSQLALSAGAGIDQWAFRNAGGDLYLSTTTTDGTATTSTSALVVSGSGFGTTTVSGLSISAQATSTSNVGFNITTGCYAIRGGCLGGAAGIGSVNSVDASGGTTGLSFSGGPITNSGTLTLAGTLGLANGGTATTTFYSGGLVFSDGTKLTQSASASNFFWDETNKRLGLGTTTPTALLALQGPVGSAQVLDIASSTGASMFHIMASGNVGIASTTPGSLFGVGGDGVGINFGLGTSTFSTTGGINLTKGGCFAVGGTCLTASSLGVSGVLVSGVSDPGVPSLPTVLQSTSNNNVTSLAFGSNVVSGNRIIVHLYCAGGQSGTQTVTDTRGTTYTQATTFGGGKGQVFIGQLGSSGANTVSYSGGTCSATTNFTIEEMSGSSGVIDAQASQTGANSPAPSVTTVTTNDMITSYEYAGSTFNPGTVTSPAVYDTGTNGFGSPGASLSHKAAGTPGTYTSGLNQQGTGDSITIAWKATPVASPGNNGDWYANTTNGALWGPKTSGTWSGSGMGVVLLQGTNGTGINVSSAGNIGFATTTSQYVLNPYSASAPQLSLSAGGGINQWAFANQGGNFYLASTTVAGSATSSLAALTIIGSTGNVGFATTTPWAQLSVNSNPGVPAFVVGSSTATSLIVDKNGSVGVGTSTPWAGFSVNSFAAQPAFVIGSSTATSFIVDKSGNVGLGTTTPWAQLSINSVASSQAFVIGSSTATSFIVDKSGNVGIGTSTPGTNFVVNLPATNIAMRVGNQGCGDTLIGISFVTASVCHKYALLGGDGSTYINRGSGGEILFREDNATQMKIQTGGAVKIGTANDNGLLNFGDLSGAGTNVGLFRGTENAIGGGNFLNLGGYAGISLSTGNAALASQTERMHIDVGGNIGIATTTPWALLSVNSTAGAPQFVVGSSTATSFIVDKNGNVGVGTTSPSTALNVVGNTTINGNLIANSSPVDSLTGFLLHFNGTNGSTTFTDSSFSPLTVTPHSGAQISSASSEFGGTSGKFNGTSDYLSIPYSSAVDLSGGDMTIEAWFNTNSFASTQVIVSKDTSGSNFDWDIQLNSSTAIEFFTSGTASHQTATVPAMSPGVWYHVAFVRHAGTNTFYLNGVSYGTSAFPIDNSDQNTFTVGAASWNAPGGFFNGYIDELRISKTARYLANFTPPSQAFNTSSVGIMTATPFNVLDVNGGVAIGAYAGTTTAPLNGLIVSGTVGFGTSTPVAVLDLAGTLGSQSDLFNVSSTTATNAVSSLFRIQANGRIGIGTTTPTALLALQGPAGSAQVVDIASSTGASMFHIMASGNVGIASTSPWRTFSVQGNVSFSGLTAGAGAGALCLSATNEVVYSAGATCTVSSARFKNNIATSTTGLDLVNQLRPVTYDYNANIGVPGNQFGFIAEEVEKIDPRLVVHDATGAPYSVRYENLTAVLAKAIQELDLNIETIASTTATSTPRSESFVSNFFDNIFNHITAWLGDATNGIGKLFAKEVHTDTLCVGDTCVTQEQFLKMVQQSANVSSSVSGGSTGGTTSGGTATSTDTTVPVISIIGNNPASVTVGSSYVDLGASVTDTDATGGANNNLGIHYNVDGVDVSDISIDTSTSTTHTIIYSATDGAGNTGTATRIVNVIDPNATATTTTATSTTP